MNVVYSSVLGEQSSVLGERIIVYTFDILCQMIAYVKSYFENLWLSYPHQSSHQTVEDFCHGDMTSTGCPNTKREWSRDFDQKTMVS